MGGSRRRKDERVSIWNRVDSTIEEVSQMKLKENVAHRQAAGTMAGTTPALACGWQSLGL